MAGFVLAARSGAQTVSFPIVVPLHFTPISTGTYKLGIYAGIGNGATPALFELDTGATGFYVTYSPNPGVSPWWGSDVTSLNTPVDTSYASGLHYTGTLVEAPITLFASSDPSSARLTTPVLKVGQMDSIVDEKTNTVIWNPSGSPSGDPPVNGAFYGDLGMGLTYNPNGIINLLAQLNYGPGRHAGIPHPCKSANPKGLPPDRSHPQGYCEPFCDLPAHESGHRGRQQHDTHRTPVF